MDFTQLQAPDGTVVSMSGSFTFKDHHGFRAIIEALSAGSGLRRVLDMSRVDFVDSAALGMLLIGEEELRKRNAALVLRKPSVTVLRLFELSAMDSVFEIERA